ncbi:hypothetical protein WJX77_001659 [Trebouxia sp. C0004]
MATSYIEAHAIQLSNTGAYSGRVTSWQSTGVSWVFSHSSSVWLPFAEFKAMAVLCTLAERFATAVAMIAHELRLLSFGNAWHTWDTVQALPAGDLTIKVIESLLATAALYDGYVTAAQQPGGEEGTLMLLYHSLFLVVNQLDNVPGLAAMKFNALTCQGR